MNSVLETCVYCDQSISLQINELRRNVFQSEDLLDIELPAVFMNKISRIWGLKKYLQYILHLT
jgi:hypothetical protein